MNESMHFLFSNGDFPVRHASELMEKYSWYSTQNGWVPRRVVEEVSMANLQVSTDNKPSLIEEYRGRIFPRMVRIPSEKGQPIMNFYSELWQLPWVEFLYQNLHGRCVVL